MIDAGNRALTLATLALSLAAAISGPALPDEVAPVLHFVDSFDLHHGHHGLNEPSALAYDAEADTLWTVSDDGPFLFEITRSAEILRKIPLSNKVQDPEAVAIDASTQRILVLSEKDAAIHAVDLNNPEGLAMFPIMEMSRAAQLRQMLDVAGGTLSPEGMTIDPATGVVFVTNEKPPRLLLSISNDLHTILSVETLDAADGFKNLSIKDMLLDISGLARDTDRRAIWFLSDTGKSLFFRRDGETRAVRYALRWLNKGKERQVRNAEGVSIDAASGTLFIASDDGKSSRLFLYKIK